MGKVLTNEEREKRMAEDIWLNYFNRYLFEADIFDMEKAIEYLNRSAQAGNESAAVALTRMAQNTFLTITTDILTIVGNLSNIESYRQPQDCTTIPQHRPRKERKKDREWEHTL